MSTTGGAGNQGYPPDGPGSTPSGDILAAYDEAEPTKRAPWLLVGGAGLLVLGLVGGVTYGVGALSGGGSQPESALPAGAFAFVKVDLDPSAGQKVDGFRFLRQFPALKDKLGSDDLRKVAFEAVAEGAGWDVDFESDVSAWMGDRVAVAAYPPRATGDQVPEPDVVVALQVSDADAARVGLGKLADAEARGVEPGSDTSELGFVIAGDYALLAETQELADRAAEDAADSALAGGGDFSRDLADAGEGVLTAWVDAARMTESLGAAGAGMGMLGAPGMVGGVAGRSTYVARFDGPDVFELTGRVYDADTADWATHRVQGLAELPASSVVAVGVADGDELVTRAFASIRKSMAAGAGGAAAPSFDEMVGDAERELGIEIPGDIGALLGDNLVAAMDGTESGQLQVGARVSTDVARAERVLDAITRASGDVVPLVRRRVGDDLVVASTPKQADRLAAEGTLGDEPGFTRALPDLDDADLAVWVDVNAVVAAVFGGFSSDPAPADENLARIDGVGVTVTSGDKGSATFRLRLVTS